MRFVWPRFFKIYNSAAKAKESQAELLRFLEEKTDGEWDRKRMLESCTLMQAGMEQLSEMLPSSMSIHESIRKAAEPYGDLVW